jgi:hypothetical protein
MQFSHLAQSWRWQQVSFWRAIVVMSGTLLLLLAASYRLSPRQASLLLGVTVSSWVVLFFWRRPQWGLVAIIPVSMLLGISRQLGFASYGNEPMLFIVLLTVLWLVGMFVRQEQSFLVRSRTLLPLLALVVSALLAFANGQLLWFRFASPAPMPAQLGGLGLFVIAAAAFLLVAHQARELKWLQYMTWLFLLFGASFIVARLVPALPTAQLFQRGAFSSIFYLWFIALALGQALFNHELRINRRVVLAALALAALLTLWFLNRDWASGWGPALIAILTLIVLRSWRLALLMVVLGIGAKLAFDPNLLPDLIAADQYSINTRWVAWEIVVGQIVRVSPLLGLGPANYYHYTPLFPILGWYVQFNSHNQYVDLVAQIGIVGLLCFLWFFWEVGRLAWRLREQVVDGFTRAYVYGALAGLIGTLAAGMLADWVIPFVYNIGFVGFRSSLWAWLFLGGLVAIEQTINNGDDAG